MNSANHDEEKASGAKIRKAVEALKETDATKDRGDMPVNSSGHPETGRDAPKERLPPDDEN